MKQWWDISISVEVDDAERKQLVDDILALICGAHDVHDPRHECARQWVASDKPSPEDDLEDGDKPAEVES
jgi:hypothetical protein